MPAIFCVLYYSSSGADSSSLNGGYEIVVSSSVFCAFSCVSALENAANGDLLKSCPENLVASTCEGDDSESPLVSSASSGERPKAAAIVILPGDYWACLFCALSALGLAKSNGLANGLRPNKPLSCSLSLAGLLS